MLVLGKYVTSLLEFVNLGGSLILLLSKINDVGVAW